MPKTVLYIGGGFDILHENHRRFIIQGIESFKELYGELEEVIIGLKPDFRLNEKKGRDRPFFSYEWRAEDISGFLEELDINYSVIPSTDFLSKFGKRNDVVAQVVSDNPERSKKMESYGIPVLYIDPINLIHTSTFESRLFEMQKKSNCNLRKVGALLIREGEIISEGYSGAGDCDCCSKYIAYQKGGGKLSKTVECDYPHAETIALKEAKKGDDLLVTDSPCQGCAELAVKNGIRRLVYLREYHDIKPLEYLKNQGVKIRRSGI